MVCARCKVVILTTDPRLVIGGLWMCARCAYRHDYPQREAQPADKPKRWKAPLPERMFPVE